MCYKSISFVSEFNVSAPIRLKISLLTSGETRSQFVAHFSWVYTEYKRPVVVRCLAFNDEMLWVFHVRGLVLPNEIVSLWNSIISCRSWAIKSRVPFGADAMFYFVNIDARLHKILFTAPCKITTKAKVIVILNYFILLPTRCKYKNTHVP